MPVEAAVYLDTLNPSNPTGAEKAGQGDDHLRLLKRVLQSTFPAVSAAVTLSAAVLNALPARVKVFEDNLLVSGAFKLVANLDANSKKIVNLADPASAQDADTKAARDAAIAALWPVGAIYLSTVSTNPATLLGFGTWAARGAGRVLAGVGTGTDQNSVAKTLTQGNNNGEYQHTLLAANLPAGVVTDASFVGGNGDNATPFGTAQNLVDTKTGAAAAFNVTPPTFAVYVWERTA